MKPRKILNETTLLATTTVLLFALFIISSLIRNALTGGEFFTSLFFFRGRDAFMDFFNSVYHNVSFNTYSLHKTIYPPLVALLFHLVSLLLPRSEAMTTNLEFLQAYVRGNAAINVCFLLFIAFCLMLTLHSIWVILKRKPKYVFIACALMVIFSYPVLAALERGNVLLASLAFLFFFLAHYSSERLILKELALISLAISVAIKIYPIFLLFFVRKKDLIGAIKTISYIVIFAVLPFAFYGGFDGFFQLIHNAFSWADHQTATAGFFSNFFVFLRAHSLISSHVLTILNILTTLLFAAMIFFAKDDADVMIISFLCLMHFPGTSLSYTVCFAMPALVIAFASVRKWGHTLMVVGLMLLGYVNGFFFNGTTIYPYCALAGMFVLAAKVCGWNPVTYFFEQKRQRLKANE